METPKPNNFSLTANKENRMKYYRYLNGEREAAQFLGCSKRTVARARANGEFPQPCHEIKIKKFTLYVWYSEDLEKYRPQLKKRGWKKGRKRKTTQ